MDDRFKELTTRLRREMNGAVSHSMRSLDPAGQRKINFGVSLPTIKHICLQYGRDHSLAEQLRSHDIREWHLAAAYIDTPEAVDTSYAEHIASLWKSTEEANVYAMSLFCLSTAAAEIAKMWLSSSDRLRAVSAGRIVSCIAGNISDETARELALSTSDEVPTRAIYEHHPALRSLIRARGPYSYSWLLDEIDRI